MGFEDIHRDEEREHSSSLPLPPFFPPLFPPIHSPDDPPVCGNLGPLLWQRLRARHHFQLSQGREGEEGTKVGVLDKIERIVVVEEGGNLNVGFFSLFYFWDTSSISAAAVPPSLQLVCRLRCHATNFTLTFLP